VGHIVARIGLEFDRWMDRARPAHVDGPPFRLHQSPDCDGARLDPCSTPLFSADSGNPIPVPKWAEDVEKRERSVRHSSAEN